MFEVKAKINFLVPSDVINRSKSTDFNTKRSQLLVISVARTRFEYFSSGFKYLYSLVKYAKIVLFQCAGRKVKVEQGIEIRV